MESYLETNGNNVIILNDNMLLNRRDSKPFQNSFTSITL